jgi:hypothetical protein
LVGLTVRFCPAHTADSLLAAQVSCELFGTDGFVVAGLVHTVVLPGTRLNPAGTLVVNDSLLYAVGSLLSYHSRTNTVPPAAAVTLADQVAPPSVEYNNVFVVAADADPAPVIINPNINAATPNPTVHLRPALPREDT